MKISSLMTSDPIGCAPATNLAEAAALMLKGDCGILPVVDGGKVCGVVTDRDLFIALGTRDIPASRVAVRDVMTGQLFACGPDDAVDDVLGVMRAHSIRRVPVLSSDGVLLGMVSMNDMLLALHDKKSVPRAAIVDALESISAHPLSTPELAAV
jgi:CBS domain-containing protein